VSLSNGSRLGDRQTIMGAVFFDWVRAHEIALACLTGISVLTFFGSLVAIPWLVIRIPADYFEHRRHLLADRLATRHPLVRVAALILKNSLGVALILAGVAMLVLPGQGILTILIGLIVMDFPGKFALEQWVARRRSVLNAMNWLRMKANHPPIKPPPARSPRAESP
jgi:hypothetical protein